MTTKLYVGGHDIGVSIEDTDLDEYFSKYGRIAKIWVARKPPGFAFVEYDDSRDADDAVAGMDGREIRGCRLRVEVSRGGARRSGGGGDIEMKPGDWKCEKCHIVNFARRTECFRCGAPKPRSRSRSYDRYDRRGRGRGRDRYDDRYDRRRSPPRRRYSRSRSPPRRERRRSRSASPRRDRRRSSSRDRRRSPSPAAAAPAAAASPAKSKSRSRSPAHRRSPAKSKSRSRSRSHGRRRSASRSRSKGSGDDR